MVCGCTLRPAARRYSTVPSVEPPSITMISSTHSLRSCGTMTRTASISSSVGSSSVVVSRSLTRHPSASAPPPFPPPASARLRASSTRFAGEGKGGDVLEIPVIGHPQPLGDGDFRPPAQPRGPPDVHQLPRHAVGLAGIEHDLARVADDVLD